MKIRALTGITDYVCRMDPGPHRDRCWAVIKQFSKIIIESAPVDHQP